MGHNLILTGDIDLLGVTDPAVPFACVQDWLRAADVVFANLECCFYEPEGERSPEDEGFYAPLKAAEALTIAGVHAVGNANNVNYGAPAIRSSLARLDELGILHIGAGVNSVEARKPVIVERDDVRFGFLQRTSVYWSHGHEATANYPGVATLKAHTAYRPQIEQLRTLTCPGMPPEIVTGRTPLHWRNSARIWRRSAAGQTSSLRAITGAWITRCWTIRWRLPTRRLTRVPTS
jgi:hypothetical protein